MWQFLNNSHFLLLKALERSSSHLVTQSVLNPKAAFEYFLLVILMEETLDRRGAAQCDPPSTDVQSEALHSVSDLPMSTSYLILFWKLAPEH